MSRYDPLADDIDDEHLETFDHSNPLLADELRTPARAFGAAVPPRIPYLRDQETVIIDPNRGRHREPRRIDFENLGYRIWGAIMLAVGLIEVGLLGLAEAGRFELPTVEESTLIAFMLNGFAIAGLGFLVLQLTRRSRREEVNEIRERLARFEDLLATAGFETR